MGILSWILFGLVIGVIATVGVFGALFLPDWPSDEFQAGFRADPGSEKFVEWTSAFLNSPVFQGGEVTLLQNGDGFYPSMLEAIRGARSTITFETYIYWSGEIGEQFTRALAERARAGVKVHLLFDALGSDRLDALRGAAAGDSVLAFDEQWPLWAHRGQTPGHDEWTVWVMLTGRGFGKTRAGAEWIWARAREDGQARIATPQVAQESRLKLDG